jgi:hypothetical protein
MRCTVVVGLVVVAPLIIGADDCVEDPDTFQGWTFHAIDASGQGADGVNVADVDGDGDLDLTSGWEESGWVKLYFNPGPSSVTSPWPSVDVEGGLNLYETEDASFADFDGDGDIDAIVSACDNPCRKIGIHWLVNPGKMGSASAWKGTWLDATTNDMFLKTRVGQIDGVGGRDVVAGSKTKGGAVGHLIWYRAPAVPSHANAGAWKAYTIAQISWIKNIEILDIDKDGDNDILISDDTLSWFENPGVPATSGWVRHDIAKHGIFSLCDMDKDGEKDIVAVSSPKSNVFARWYKRQAGGTSWKAHDVKVQNNHIPPGSSEYVLKGVDCGDLDGDGKIDLAFSASGEGPGVVWLSHNGATPAASGYWDWHGVLKDATMKFDNIRAVDLDKDGDLDLVSTDENGGFMNKGWGVIWFENKLP